MPNNFSKLCPSGNAMVDGYKETKVKDPNDYSDLREEQDREE